MGVVIMETNDLKDNISILAGMVGTQEHGEGNVWYFDPKNKGFYKPGVNTGPDFNTAGMVEVSDTEHRQLMEGLGSKFLGVENGRPVLVDPEPPTAAQLAAVYTRRKNTLMAEAVTHITALQAAVDLGDATEGEQSELVAWRTYAIAVRRVDVNASVVTWPERVISP